ncbi:hypothetical protein [unidentified bacterial endosymbiont]|uniref:hypothetical protein n=1 Tax=unidentified bacterial endosymbiont TaxID=2355 RepID=UPI0020A04BD8|nr:hypothetical protein [unidentified bacterial endosymbiont]
MRTRSIAAQNATTDRQLILLSILKVKEHSEDKLRRQLTELIKTQQTLEVSKANCAEIRAGLRHTLGQMLAWSGTLPASLLQQKKGQMNQLFHHENVLAAQERLLSDEIKKVQAHQATLQQNVIILLKKKEKIRSLLRGEYEN